MHSFHVYYHNTQGTLMRILNAISRRGLDLPYVQAEPVQTDSVQSERVATSHRVSLLLNLSPKQIGQLSRDWYAIADVAEVQAGAPTDEMMEFAESWDAARRPAVAAIRRASSAATA